MTILIFSTSAFPADDWLRYTGRYVRIAGLGVHSLSVSCLMSFLSRNPMIKAL